VAAARAQARLDTPWRCGRL